jgi:cell wall-associated NlpC family hydrolase
VPTGPASFDCSGLVQTAYRAAGVGLPRVSRHQYGAVDGDFGPRTRRALVAFQRARGLAPDGMVGAHTWGALVSSGRMRSQAKC